MISDAFTAARRLAASNVREKRGLTLIYRRDESNPDSVASCERHEGDADYYD